MLLRAEKHWVLVLRMRIFLRRILPILERIEAHRREAIRIRHRSSDNCHRCSTVRAARHPIKHRRRVVRAPIHTVKHRRRMAHRFPSVLYGPSASVASLRLSHLHGGRVGLRRLPSISSHVLVQCRHRCVHREADWKILHLRLRRLRGLQLRRNVEHPTLHLEVRAGPREVKRHIRRDALLAESLHESKVQHRTILRGIPRYLHRHDQTGRQHCPEIDRLRQPLRVEQHRARCERAPVERLPMLVCRRLC